MQRINIWPAFANLVNLLLTKDIWQKVPNYNGSKHFYCSAAAPRCNLYAEVLGLIQHFTAFVFHHLFSWGGNGDSNASGVPEGVHDVLFAGMGDAEGQLQLIFILGEWNEISNVAMAASSPFFSKVTVYRFKAWHANHKISVFQEVAREFCALQRCSYNNAHFAGPWGFALTLSQGPSTIFKLLHIWLGLWESHNFSCPFYSCSHKRLVLQTLMCSFCCTV